ncbi:hypothetical protein [Usitatibacter palustris]|uniref:Uncharacterized protein n=1 Tax=Usitatibacter palustris TaxID=2732487 RepID=A0A6M4H3J4_9PROT|nr:hypothetical protein [Usitatibacter palustris]QJR14096.1 hypothetical protein DSM104440_00889 [Usitatibacter palustris]
MKRLKLLIAALAAAGAIPAHAVGHLADVRAFDRAQGIELPVYWHEGRAYVVGRPGNEYQVSVRNQAGEDLLAVVSVDGVNVLNGETAAASQGGYVLANWESLGIKGWRKSTQQTAAFYFTSLGDSYAGRTGRPDNVGVIGAALFRRMAPPPPPPAAMAPDMLSSLPEERHRNDYQRKESGAGTVESRRAPASPSPSLADAGPLGTGHGRREYSPVRTVTFQRATDQPAEMVTIYYDSHRNLVARGILKEAPAPRNPLPFPGWVPDPA